MWHVWVTGEVQTKFWWGDLRVKDHLEDLGGDGKIILKTDLQKVKWGHGLDISGSG